MWSLICHILLTCLVWYHLSHNSISSILAWSSLVFRSMTRVWFWLLPVLTFEYDLIWCLCGVLSFFMYWCYVFYLKSYTMSFVMSKLSIHLCSFQFTNLHDDCMLWCLNYICMTFRSKTCPCVYLDVMLLLILIW